jgi:hypothetical protein
MEQNDGSVMGVKSIFIGFPWWITCSSSFAFLLEIERTDGNIMEVKPIFIGFPWWITWSSSFALNKQLINQRINESGSYFFAHTR